MAKNVKNASKAQAEGLKYVPMRKAARAMTFVAGVLSSGIVVFSVAEAAWAWAARSLRRWQLWRSILRTL